MQNCPLDAQRKKGIMVGAAKQSISGLFCCPGASQLHTVSCEQREPYNEWGQRSEPLLGSGATTSCAALFVFRTRARERAKWK